MKGALQEESLRPIQSQRTFPQFVEGGGEGFVFYFAVYPRCRQEEKETARHADHRAIEGDAQVGQVDRPVAPVHEMDGNGIDG